MRVHFYPHKGPKTTAHIVGEKSGLLKLSKALEQAARGAVGTETVELYSGDGHSYEVVITKDVSKKSLALTRSQQLEIKNDKRKSQL